MPKSLKCVKMCKKKTTTTIWAIILIDIWKQESLFLIVKHAGGSIVLCFFSPGTAALVKFKWIVDLFWHKTCRLLLDSLRWRKISPFQHNNSRQLKDTSTMEQLQKNKTENLDLLKSEPWSKLCWTSVDWLEAVSAHEIALKMDRSGAVLQGVEKYWHYRCLNFIDSYLALHYKRRVLLLVWLLYHNIDG